MRACRAVSKAYGQAKGAQTKKPDQRSGFFLNAKAGSGDGDLLSLQAFLALGHGERHLLTFLQALEAGRLDRAEVNEHVVTALIATDEAKTLGVVEPLHGTGFHLGHFHFPYSKRSRIAAKSWSQGETGTTV
jgi:hypothetical protein